MRYTLPDFFPDFNETPLEARINSGADTRMKAQGGTGGGGGGGGGGSKSYVWKRGVLAGTERSDPLDVIAKDRERFERTLGGEGREFAPADEDSNDVDSGLTNAGGSGPRRAIPPPPGYAERPRRAGRRHKIVGGAHPLLLPHGAGGDVVEEHTGRRAAGADAGDGTSVGGAAAAGGDRWDGGGRGVVERGGEVSMISMTTDILPRRRVSRRRFLILRIGY